MKKLVLMFVAIVAVSFASCGNKAAAEKAKADSIRMADSIAAVEAAAAEEAAAAAAAAAVLDSTAVVAE